MTTPAIERMSWEESLRTQTAIGAGLMASSEATGDSCRLYLAWATDKLPSTAQNPPETPLAETRIKIGISSDQKAEELDRRIPVAPMMDWTEHLQLPLSIMCLSSHRRTCLPYVSSDF